MGTGKRIRELRMGLGLTLEELAKRSQCSKSYIWEIENRKTSRPSAEKLSTIAAQLGMTVDYLLGTETEEDPKDKCFYGKYKSLDSETKSKIRKIAEILSK